MNLNKYDITVIAPSAPGAKASEKIQGVKVKRFVYFYPSKLQLLTSGEGILYTSRKAKLLGKLQIVTFIIAEFFSVINVLVKDHYDIIHANWILPQGAIAMMAKFIFKKPVVITVHGTDIFALNKFNFIKYLILKYCNVCTTNSSATYEAAYKINQNANIKIVHMGTDIKSFDPKKKDQNWRKQFGDNPKIILGVGRLIKWKGFEYLVKAFPAVLAKFPEVKLIIVGKGPEEIKLKKLSTRLNLEKDKNIFFPEHFSSDRLPFIYASSDLVVCPSITITATGEKEGQGNVALEARASGIPVIASRSGGLVDTIDGKTNGLLFKEGDYKELAQKIIEVFSNENLRRSLSKIGLKHVRQNFSWRKTSQKFEELYEEIINR